MCDYANGHTQKFKILNKIIYFLLCGFWIRFWIKFVMWIGCETAGWETACKVSTDSTFILRCLVSSLKNSKEWVSVVRKKCIDSFLWNPYN